MPATEPGKTNVRRRAGWGAFLLAASACSGGEIERPRRPVEAALNATTAAPSARFQVEVLVSDEDGEGSWEETTTGLADLAAGETTTKTQVAFEDPPPDFEGVPPRWSVVEGDYVYLKGERVTENVPGAPEWVRMPLAETSPTHSIGAPGMDAPGVVGLLAGAVGGADDRGMEEVRGVDAVRYEVELDPERVLAQAPDYDRASEAVGFFEELGYEDGVPVEVWIDGENRLVRFRLSSEDGSETRTVVTVEMYDFGAEAEIAPPGDAVPVNLFDLF